MKTTLGIASEHQLLVDLLAARPELRELSPGPRLLEMLLESL